MRILTWAEVRQSVANGFRTWQRSTIVVLVVIPILLDQIVSFFSPQNSQKWYAAEVVVVVGLLGAIAFLFVAIADYRRKLAQQRATTTRGLSLLDDEVHNQATALVIQSQPSTPGKKEVSLSDFLLAKFPNVREVVLVGSPDGFDTTWVPAKSGVTIGDPITIPAFQVFNELERSAVLIRLQQLAAGHSDGMVLIDVTRGTKAMSLNMAEVARVLGMLVTYTPIHDGHYSGIYCVQPATVGGTSGDATVRSAA